MTEAAQHSELSRASQAHLQHTLSRALTQTPRTQRCRSQMCKRVQAQTTALSPCCSPLPACQCKPLSRTNAASVASAAQPVRQAVRKALATALSTPGRMQP